VIYALTIETGNCPR